MRAARWLPVPLKRLGRAGERRARQAVRVAPFWARTGLNRFTPGGYGYTRRLRQLRDPTYVHERDKHPVRRKHHGEEGWQSEWKDGLLRRDYASYEEYVTHQQQKFDEVLKLGEFFSARADTVRRLRFYRRFRHLVALLPRDARIVCLGARQGTEVEVLRELGFSNAYGIDLNPGPDNPYVIEGDFHALDEPDGSVDLVYTNSIDHAFDRDRFFDEQLRVLRAGGYLLLDVPLGAVGEPRGPCESVSWQTERVVVEGAVRRFEEVVRVETEPAFRWFLLRR